MALTIFATILLGLASATNNNLGSYNAISYDRAGMLVAPQAPLDFSCWQTFGDTADDLWSDFYTIEDTPIPAPDFDCEDFYGPIDNGYYVEDAQCVQAAEDVRANEYAAAFNNLEAAIDFHMDNFDSIMGSPPNGAIFQCTTQACIDAWCSSNDQALSAELLEVQKAFTKFQSDVTTLNNKYVDARSLCCSSVPYAASVSYTSSDCIGRTQSALVANLTSFLMLGNIPPLLDICQEGQTPDYLCINAAKDKLKKAQDKILEQYTEGYISRINVMQWKIEAAREAAEQDGADMDAICSTLSSQWDSWLSDLALYTAPMDNAMLGAYFTYLTDLSACCSNGPQEE